MSQYILAHDLGTSGNKATLYDLEGKLICSVVSEYETFFPKANFCEQNPNDWWRAVCDSTKKLLEKSNISNSSIISVCFSAQMMGCLIIDKFGKPIRPMIIWADTRASMEEEMMNNKIGKKRGYEITGHRLSASYSGAKLLWIKNNEPENYNKADKMLHAKDYIIYKLTGEIVTDYSDASGTNLLDINNKSWSEEIINELDINKNLLPTIYPSTHIAGKIKSDVAREIGLLEGTPVVIGGGDGSCACVGAGVVSEGKAYNVIGSSSWISFASKKPLLDTEMRTFNWIHLDENYYTPCGTMQAAGLSYKWYKDLFADSIIKSNDSSKDIYQILNESALLSKEGANGLLFLPYLLGERSPLWNANAKGAFIGLSMTTTKNDMVRAVLEGVGYNLKIILEILESLKPLENIIMIGGGAKGREWVQILADIWQKNLSIPKYLEEATSMGAAICGGIGVGAFKNFEVITKFNNINEIITPDATKKEIYDKMYKAFTSSYYGLYQAFEMISKI